MGFQLRTSTGARRISARNVTRDIVLFPNHQRIISKVWRHPPHLKVHCWEYTLPKFNSSDEGRAVKLPGGNIPQNGGGFNVLVAFLFFTLKLVGMIQVDLRHMSLKKI